MNNRQRHALALRETDVDGAIKRLGGDEELYAECLTDFLDDKTTEELNIAVEHGVWDEAFTAAHALKGVAGNMGFVPLMHSVGQLLVIIRGGRLKDINESLEQVNSCYRDITDGINQYFLCKTE
ncbi:MAG: Hpt domain-containing protein [Eubacteriales bacterium]|nr:Hpt domain-containing protein [Eubacteriales bacterium]MDD3881054.1 Hpt domain-containing protein [Eubacteriales bacterium]MDD4511877.1 Hpt domain-containing protein [Eubacteriales bacterium]